MEKSSMERDLDDWEFLSDDGLLDLGCDHHDTAKSVLVTRGSAGFSPRGLVDMNYFVCPPSPPHLLIGAAEGFIPSEGIKSRGFPEPGTEKNPDDGFIKEIRVAPPVMLANQEVISQVFFRKLGESEFADIKIDSPPKSPTTRSLKQSLVEIPGMVKCELKGGEEGPGKGEAQINGGDIKVVAPTSEQESKALARSETRGRGCLHSFGFSIWRWRVTGVGALCSIGVAAATICIFILSGRQRHKHQQNQKLQFQICHDEKSIKQVVRQATRINQAISVVRGVPMARAHISFGGYYDGL
ncbi:hypothetical protein Taro_013814 [Colocasia esculenta]|uniref:DUF6821 domain-containing protein n=1 Tax=Colocasia esculenta TaxID=4460 RepID=A0A843UCQ6_COLES|nr:hypothetical protein [Colocasia esculenta]